ncbi:MAG: serine/threonine-protein phosphatase [Bacteroidales bacterium]|nr:serine/threonine-protein phosphatase [Bacteroidales bacterium]
MRIEIYPPLSIHEIGQRDNQEDALWPLQATAADRLFVLCDGMGGHEKGEVASQTVCQSLGKWFSEHVNPDVPFTDDNLREALEYAYQQLDKYADDSPKQMGTTLTLIYISKNGVTAAHIGDSRIYHIRPGKAVLYQSRDHSLVFDLFQAGEITYEDMATYPQKNIITRAMTPGVDNRMRPDIIHITDIQTNDYFYLCSDGMLEQMGNDELVNILSSKEKNEGKCQKLVSATVDNQDNHSAWLIHVKEVIKEDGDDKLTNEEPTARCNAINITPRPISNDVQIADDDDVVMVSLPKPVKKKWPLRQMVLTAIAFLLALVAAWFLFLRDTGKEETPIEKPMMQTPIKPISNKNLITKDTIIIKKHESERNQQSGDAPCRNDTTRHLPHR